MFNQYGLLTRSEKSENQNTIRDPELSRILNDLYITDNKEFLGELNGWCTTSSYNRCYFYMSLNYENKTYTQKNRKIPYVLPTYGVKGTDAISRDMKYVNQYLQKYEEMLGSTFIDYVFGTNYIQHEEPQSIVSESEAVSRLRRKMKPVSHEVEETELICRTLERIWAAREQDSKTRIVIVLKDAQERSMDLLRQLYLLLPQKLRAQTGFETNVAVADLDMISKNSLPMYILTVDEEYVKNLSSEYLRGLKFPVEFIELSAIDAYPCDPGRLDLLRCHCENLSEITEICMDYAERKIMEKKKQNYSSFRIYEDILRKTYSSNLYWWREKELKNISQICAAYNDQREIMEIPLVKEEAVKSFYTERIPEGDFAEQILEAVCDPSYPERDNILECLREDLYYGKEMDAIEKYARKRDQELEREMTLQESRLFREKEDALEAQQTEHTKVIRQKDAQIQDLKQTLQDAQEKSAEFIGRQEGELRQLRNEKKDIQKRLEEALEAAEAASAVAGRRGRGRRGSENDAQSEEIAYLKKENEELQQQNKKTGIARNVLGVLTGVFAAVGICAMVFFFMEKSTSSDLNKQLESVQSNYNEKEAELKSTKSKLNKKIARLTQENEALKAAETETETEPETEEITEEETELQTEGYISLGILY